MLARRRHARRCRKLAAACGNPVLEAYLEAAAGVEVRDLERTPTIAVDLELTGLDASRHRIVAVGWTLIDDGRIRIGSNRHVLVRGTQSVGDSATIHELVDRDLAGGAALNEALESLFTAGTGRVWVFHHAPLDVGFLRVAAEAWTGCRPPFALLDTMELERRRRERRGLALKASELRLDALRAHYHLPRYRAHDALIDAFATAELLLAQLAHAGSTDLRGSVQFV